MAATDTAAGARAAPAIQGTESRKTAWAYTALVVALYVVNWGDKTVLGLVAQDLKDEIGVNEQQIGMIASAFFVLFIVGNLGAGFINRHLSLRWSLAFLAIGWALAMFPVTLSATFTVLLLSRMFLGLLEGPSYPLVHTAVYSWHPIEKRGLPSAVLTMSASLAKILIAPVLAVVAHQYGWRAAFLSLAGAGLVWLLVWLPTWKKPGPYGGEAVKGAAQTEADKEPNVPWRKVLTSGTFIGAVLASMPTYAIVAAVLTFLPSYFEKGLGFSRVQAGAMFGAPSIASIITLTGVAFISDKLLARGVSSRLLRGVLPTCGLLICSIALITLPYIKDPYLAVAWVSVGYALGVTVLPLFNAGLSEIVPPKQFAATIGIFLALQSLGGVYGPYLAGMIVKNAGSALAGYPLAFQVFGATTLVGAVIALVCVNPARDKARLRGIPS
ncbi:MAG: MFS transporter [Acidovorax sp.]